MSEHTPLRTPTIGHHGLPKNAINSFNRCIEMSGATVAQLEAFQAHVRQIKHPAVLRRSARHLCAQLVTSRYMHKAASHLPDVSTWEKHVDETLQTTLEECETASQPIEVTLGRLTITDSSLVAVIEDDTLGPEIESLYEGLELRNPLPRANVRLTYFDTSSLTRFKRQHFASLREAFTDLQGQTVVLGPLQAISPSHWRAGEHAS